MGDTDKTEIALSFLTWFPQFSFGKNICHYMFYNWKKMVIQEKYYTDFSKNKPEKNKIHED